ncbi:MAG: universal stress protein [Rhodobacteraceae bacterium]|nr:universal stress protein [Paracoccaceae bacterium]
MSYKSLLTVVTREEAAGAPLASAVTLARRWDAHLHVLCIGIEQIVTDYYFAGATLAVRQDLLDEAAKAAEALDRKVRARLGVEDIRWSAEQAVVQPGLLATLVALRARFADLVVMPRPYGPAGDENAVAALEAALFGGGAPVLVLPDGGLPEPFPARIVLAWNESAEAMRAARAALPLMKSASQVEIAVVDPDPYGPERSDPGGALSEMLARHGVRTEIAVLAKTLPRVSDLILRQARETGAGLIVMGAYGHSRLREAILGGATRAMLEQSELPVFLAH